MATPYLDKEGFYASQYYFPEPRGTNEYSLHNADKLWGYLINTYHWTLPAVCAFYGAIQYECDFNQRLVEGQKPVPIRGSSTSGTGLVQWTPPDNLLDFANTYGSSWEYAGTQMAMLEAERKAKYDSKPPRQWYATKGGQYRNKYDEYFDDSTVYETQDEFCSNASLDNGNTLVSLCAQVVLFYTRSGTWYDPKRWERNAKAAEFYYKRYSGQDPPTPPPIPPTPPSKKSGLKVWQMIRYH